MATCIIGGGPVGLIAALACSRNEHVQLIAPRTEPAEISRIDALPAGFLALLIELGVHPHALGVDTLHRSFMASWEADSPRTAPSVPKAHVDRRILEQQLWRLVRRNPRISVSGPGAIREGATVIDATGRRALTAARRMQPPQPWIARTLCFRGQVSTAHQALRIAAVPDGYFYRLGTGRMLTIGFVGPRSITSDTLLAMLAARGLEWMLAGLPASAPPQTGRGGKASVQWSIGDASAIRIGDASLACDALSSHGIAGGVAQALRIASRREDASSLRPRRGKHLENLLAMIRECRWSDEPAWRDYAQFLSSSLQDCGAEAAQAGRA